MGHDITAYTKDGDKFSGPSFSRYWWPHYEYLEAEHHNCGISGDGKDEEMTPERFQRAVQMVEKDLDGPRNRLREIEDWIRNYQKKASKELNELASQREVILAELGSSKELHDLKVQCEEIHQKINLISEKIQPTRNHSTGLAEWRKTADGMEWDRLRDQQESIYDRIDKIEEPLYETKERIDELEPFVADFEDAVIEKYGETDRYFWAEDVDEDGKPKDERLKVVENLWSCRWNIEEYERVLSFFNRCLQEKVVRIRFW